MLFRWTAVIRRARACVLVYGPIAAGLVLVHLATHADVGLGLLLYTAGVFGGILQLYNLAERGFSLRILMDVAAAPDGLTLAAIRRQYSDGRGVDWMYAKRLGDLLARQLVWADAGSLRTTARGARLARALGAIRRFLRLGAQC